MFSVYYANGFIFFFFFQAEDGIRDATVTGVQTCALPISGVAEGLAQLHALGLKLAVVTNKPRQATIELLTRLGLARPIRAVVGGDSVAHRKPHARSEERRVGKECGSRRWRSHQIEEGRNG